MNAINIDPIVNMVLSPATHEDAAVAGFRIMHQNAASFGGLENMLSRSKDLLRLIAKRDKEIASLKAQVGQAQQALKLAEASRKAYAAEQASEKERQLENRISDAVRAMIRGSKLSAQTAPISVNPGSVTGSKPMRKTSAKASSRPRVRRVPRGADTDNMVLSLLTNELKCIGTLFRQAQGLGFSGTENAIRFAGLRLAQAGNAIEGRDYQDRIAYRRA
jgi:hypothetical protein